MAKHKHYRLITDDPQADARPHYRKILEDAFRAGKFAPGTVSTVTIEHGAGCAIFEGGACNCSPDIIQEVKP